MAYFLGNKQYGRYKPLTLVDENDEKIPNKLLDILRFTTSFESEVDLKDHLIDKHIIENYSAQLCYLISKGNKDNRYYEIIQLGDHLYLSDAAKFLSASSIKQYLVDHKYSIAFMEHLYSFYLRKFGILNMASQKFESRAYDYQQMSEWLESMLSLSFSEPFKDHLGKILSFINDPKICVKNRYINLTTAEDMYYQELISSTHYTVSEDDADIRKFVNFFKGKCRYPDIPALRHLEKMNSISNYVSSVGTGNIVDYDEQEDIRTYIEKFMASILYTYDQVTHDYKKVGGVYKITERNLCDLAMFLATYEDYINSYDYHIEHISHTPPKKEEEEPSDDEYDKEEFLEPGDFRDDIEIEEHGYNLHYGDGDYKW